MAILDGIGYLHPPLSVTVDAERVYACVALGQDK